MIDATAVSGVVPEPSGVVVWIGSAPGPDCLLGDGGSGLPTLRA